MAVTSGQYLFQNIHLSANKRKDERYLFKLKRLSKLFQRLRGYISVIASKMELLFQGKLEIESKQILMNRQAQQVVRTQKFWKVL